MSAVRRPVVTGITRASGTSTLAAALHTIDGGLLAAGTAGEADVLVCRSDEQSLRQAAALVLPAGGSPRVSAAQLHAGRTGGQPESNPVRGLPVGTPNENLDPPIPPTNLRREALASAPSGPRPVLVLAGIAPGAPTPAVPPGRFGAVVALPHVRRWIAGDARTEAAAVLAHPPERLPHDVRAYATALHRIVSALVGSGQLRRTVPPLVSRPVTTTLWRGLHAAVPRPASAPDDRREPDDEALEDETRGVAAGVPA